jgi:hypothetical protein
MCVLKYDALGLTVQENGRSKLVCEHGSTCLGKVLHSKVIIESTCVGLVMLEGSLTPVVT